MAEEKGSRNDLAQAQVLGAGRPDERSVSIPLGDGCWQQGHHRLWGRWGLKGRGEELGEDTHFLLSSYFSDWSVWQ